jgi:hypothetical protein
MACGYEACGNTEYVANKQHGDVKTAYLRFPIIQPFVLLGTEL